MVMAVQDLLAISRSVLDTSERATFISTHDQINEYFRPLQVGKHPQINGVEQYGSISNTTHITEFAKFSSILSGALLNPASDWFSVFVTNPDLMKDMDVLKHLNLRKTVLMGAMAMGGNYAYNVLNKTIEDLFLYGNSCVHIQENSPSSGSELPFTLTRCNLKYVGWTPFENVPNVVARKLYLDRFQILKEFGVDIRKYDESTEDTDRRNYEIHHLIMPIQNKGKYKFQEHYIFVDKEKILHESFLVKQPFVVSRLKYIDGDSQYGYGLGIALVALVKDLQDLTATFNNAAMYNANPAVTTIGIDPDDINIVPNGIVRGGMNTSITPIQISADMPSLNARIEQIKTDIKEMLNTDILLNFVYSKTEKTAEETRQRTTEKMTIFNAPFLAISSEIISPALSLFSEILFQYNDEAGIEVPESIKDKNIQFEYNPTLRQQMNQEWSNTTATYLANLVQLAAVDPSVLLTVDLDKYAREMAIKSGMNPNLLRTEQEVNAIKQQQQQQQMQQVQAETSNVQSDTAVNIAKAQQLSSGG